MLRSTALLGLRWKRCVLKENDEHMKLIKRKNGKYSARGLWDNIRANIGSGRKPTKAILKAANKYPALL